MSRSLRRVLFWAYCAALLYGTHGPRRDVHVHGLDRPDLVVHACAFAGWFVLLLCAEYLGPWRARRSVALCAATAAAFAAVNEATQALPIVGRTSAMDDLLANLAGVALAAAGAAVAARLFPARRRADGGTEPR